MTAYKISIIRAMILSITCFAVSSQLNGQVTSEVTPFAYNVYRGVQIAPAENEPARLQESDNSHVELRAGFTLSSVEAPVWVEFQGIAGPFTTELNSLSVESFAGTPGLTATVEMWNWNSNQWDEVGQFGEAFANQDSTEEVVLPASAFENYVNDDNSLMKTRIGWRQTGFVINNPWQVNIDELVWKGSFDF